MADKIPLKLVDNGSGVGSLVEFAATDTVPVANLPDLVTYGAVPLAGGNLTGALNDAPTQTIASATLTDIGSATSNVVAISGTTPITGLGTIAAGARRTARFLGSLLLTHNATSLILQTGTSITTAANDTAEFLSLGGGNWFCLRYNLASGKPVAFAYDRSNILGTVSQLSNVPTGSVFQFVSNANGMAIKYADGTMECWSVVDYLSSTIQGVSGSLFFGSVVGAQNYPVAFIAQPAVSQVYEADAVACWGATSGLSTNTAWSGILAFSDSSRTARTLRLHRYAIGRWC